MKKLIDDSQILTEMYRRAFANSTPKGDFDELVKNATINEYNQKVIPFMDYECDLNVMNKIINDVCKEFKVPLFKRKYFYTSFMLGCSPKTKIN
jgi:hypothetical protein